MKLWKAWNLKTKVVLSFSFLFAFSIISSGIFYYYSSVGELKKQTLQLLDTNSTQITRSIELYIEDMEKLSLSVFYDSLVQHVLSHSEQTNEAEDASLNQQITSHLLNISVSWPSVQGIYLYPTDNKAVTYYWAKRSPFVGNTIAQEPWYPYVETYTQSPYLLWPTMTENTITNFQEKKVFSLIREINQIPTGKKIGYMKMDMDIQAIKDLVSYREYGDAQDSSLFILTDQGNVIYDNQDSWTGKVIEGIKVTDLIGKSTSGTLTWQGESYLYGSYRSDHTHWTTVILKPMNSITKRLKEIRNTVMSIESLILLLVIVIAWFIATGITRPLRTMITTMRHVERGDFSIRASQTDHRNEIGQLGRVFNKMLDSLQDMISRVYVAELREKDAQLLALQAQINPHFLFNTLNVLKSLGRKGATTDVVEVTESLAHLFRYSLYDWNGNVELREELNLIQSYMKIQTIRFQDRFIYELDIPERLLKARILRLTIQPLVENAVVHGLEQRKSGGFISVHVGADDETLEIFVSDNGVGINKQTQEMLNRNFAEIDIHRSNTQTEHMGIALLNIQKRLHLIYGNQYGLSFLHKPGGGTTIRLAVPLQFE
ncbi:sensor histidine kinase [Paenibacillus alba]|uniref:Sensor histidine kinase n=1 Tax=Paenibacillus alba TaxID=1197127 RepID=A0ABU6G0A5_9BACL|nr:sensor histidine kinase [Paenibacillus alba]MEC0227588.1 sensor histidine kinase [Paenibacillus alba]